MRLWSLHPGHLDAAGLVACWREALLAQAVLRGQTRGYTRHPQLARFQACEDPIAAIGTYLQGLVEEAVRRGYAFNGAKIHRVGRTRLKVTSGQIAHEWAHLRSKLAVRNPSVLKALPGKPKAHPMFRVVQGKREDWEKA